MFSMALYVSTQLCFSLEKAGRLQTGATSPTTQRGDRWTPYAAFSSSFFYFLFVQNGTTSCLFPTEARASLRMAVVSHEVYLKYNLYHEVYLLYNLYQEV